jgi:hypothetical protein
MWLLGGWLRRTAAFQKSAAFGSKERLEELTALLLEQASDYLDSVIKPSLGWNIKDRSAGTGFGIPGSKHKPRNASLHDRSGAHGAGLQCDIECRFSESPRSKLFGRFTDHDHLRVSRGILCNLSVVVPSCDHFVVVHQNCADWDFAYVRSQSCLLERLLHEMEIVWFWLQRGGRRRVLDGHGPC